MKTELQNLVNAVEELGKIRNGKTLFEHQPSENKECAEAWLKLNYAMKEAKAILKPNSQDRWQK